MKKTDVCPGNLAEGFDRYCPRCVRQLFDGKRVSPIMDFDYDADDADLSSAINRISVSGVQEKLSAILSDGKIMLTPLGARGRYIIGRSTRLQRPRTGSSFSETAKWPI